MVFIIIIISLAMRAQMADQSRISAGDEVPALKPECHVSSNVSGKASVFPSHIYPLVVENVPT